MNNDKRMIIELREKVAKLEFHLEKLRALILHGYMSTAGVAPELPKLPTKKKKQNDSARIL